MVPSNPQAGGARGEIVWNHQQPHGGTRWFRKLTRKWVQRPAPPPPTVNILTACNPPRGHVAQPMKVQQKLLAPAGGEGPQESQVSSQPTDASETCGESNNVEAGEERPIDTPSDARGVSESTASVPLSLGHRVQKEEGCQRAGPIHMLTQKTKSRRMPPRRR